MINQIRNTTTIELFDFLKLRNQKKPITKQAISKAREHLSPDVFIKIKRDIC